MPTSDKSKPTHFTEIKRLVINDFPGTAGWFSNLCNTYVRTLPIDGLYNYPFKGFKTDTLTISQFFLIGWSKFSFYQPQRNSEYRLFAC